MATLSVTFDQGFAPDLDPSTTGIFVDCDQMFPSAAGYRPFRLLQLESSGGPLPTFPCYGAFFEQDAVDAGRAIFLASASKIYTYNILNNTFADVSGGQTFNGPANPAGYRSPRWRWTMFGGDLIVLNPADPPQVLRAPTYNAAVALGGNPPRGSIVEAVGDFVFIFDAAGNDWSCCGIGNDTTWTPDIGTQAADGTLGDTPGPIVAAHALGANLLVYKQRATYLATYLGPPVIWSFSLLADDAGAICDEAVVPYGGIQVVMGFENFYTCDGSPPRALNNPLRRWFCETSLDRANATRVWGVWDKLHNLIVWFYPSVAANPPGALDRYICWHPDSNRWMTGKIPNNVEAVVTPFVPITPQGAISYSASAVFGMALMLGDHNLYSYSGQAAVGYVTTGDIGDPMRYTLMRTVRPKFKIYPAGNAAVAIPLYRYNLGDTQFAGPESQLTRYGAFAMRQAARYHAVRIRTAADCEIVGMDVDWEPQGTR
jgi:hypothetical protein